MESKTVFYSTNEYNEEALLNDLRNELNQISNFYTIRKIEYPDFVFADYNLFSHGIAIYEVTFYGPTHRPLENGEIIVVESKETYNRTVSFNKVEQKEEEE